MSEKDRPSKRKQEDRDAYAIAPAAAPDESESSGAESQPGSKFLKSDVQETPSAEDDANDQPTEAPLVLTDTLVSHVPVPSFATPPLRMVHRGLRDQDLVIAEETKSPEEREALIREAEALALSPMPM